MIFLLRLLMPGGSMLGLMVDGAVFADAATVAAVVVVAVAGPQPG